MPVADGRTDGTEFIGIYRSKKNKDYEILFNPK